MTTSTPAITTTTCDASAEVPARPVIPTEVERAERERKDDRAGEQMQSKNLEPEFHVRSQMNAAIALPSLYFSQNA